MCIWLEIEQKEYFSYNLLHCIVHDFIALHLREKSSLSIHSISCTAMDIIFRYLSRSMYIINTVPGLFSAALYAAIASTTPPPPPEITYPSPPPPTAYPYPTSPQQHTHTPPSPSTPHVLSPPPHPPFPPRQTSFPLSPASHPWDRKSSCCRAVSNVSLGSCASGVGSGRFC